MYNRLPGKRAKALGQLRPSGGTMLIANRRISILLSLITVTTWSAISAWGQADRATLNGTVRDTSGALVPLARVDVTMSATGFHREAVTSGTGTYSLTALPIGSYTVRITARGMKPIEFQNVDLEVGQTRTLDAEVQVGEVASEV